MNDAFDFCCPSLIKNKKEKLPCWRGSRKLINFCILMMTMMVLVVLSTSP
ncbi:hypothetical protein OIU74_016040 [Salix koriyanagi]|uniref:Uncharacterized protein n=1 Tax=Salix koriyanagi TaxID=2511006 RepID=A0A9Q0SW29_9ROSI|nr:hypothetical protein OIU74_016040 [Salix koriyanagi]